MRHTYYVTYTDGFQVGACDVKAPPVSKFNIVKEITEAVRAQADPPLQRNIVITSWRRFECPARPASGRRWKSSSLS